MDFLKIMLPNARTHEGDLFLAHQCLLLSGDNRQPLLRHLQVAHGNDLTHALIRYLPLS